MYDPKDKIISRLGTVSDRLCMECENCRISVNLKPLHEPADMVLSTFICKKSGKLIHPLKLETKVKNCEFYKGESAEPRIAKEPCFFKRTVPEFPNVPFEACIYDDDNIWEKPNCQNCPHYIRDTAAINIIRAVVDSRMDPKEDGE